MDSLDQRSLPELVSSLTGDLATLVRKESELVRAEVTEKISHVGKAAGGLAVSGVLLLAAVLILLEALVISLSKIMDPALASILVAVVVGAVGFVLFKGAMKMLSPDQLTPDRSARQLKKDASLVKDQTR